VHHPVGEAGNGLRNLEWALELNAGLGELTMNFRKQFRPDALFAQPFVSAQLVAVEVVADRLDFTTGSHGVGNPTRSCILRGFGKLGCSNEWQIGAQATRMPAF
jgi:hypothetical protein